MNLTKPILGLAVGGVLGLLDGLSGFFEPSLAPVMGSVITFSLLKGLVAGMATGYISQRVHSMLLGILVKTTWTFHQDQKDAFTEDVTYVRAK